MGKDEKTRVKKQQHDGLREDNTFVRFRGTSLVLQDGHYKLLTSPLFAELFYKRFQYASIQQIKEVEHLVRNSAPDMTHLDYLIGLPDGTAWDTRALAVTASPPADPILRARIAPDATHRDKAFTYLLQLAQGDEALAWDYLQGIAPLFMDKKPAGVIWFVGGGANGKSALINAVYRIIGDHLSNMTVAAIEDGRDAPRLNGVIGNVCRESSEGRVEDTERYKAIGTHEPFEVHKFHSQEPIVVSPNFHTIFNANNIPIFSDKTEGARRRTLIVPFPAKFKDDPNFEQRTFTKKFLSGLFALILEATSIIADNQYRYNFSPATIGAKSSYDSEVNSAEAFLEHLRENKVKAFTNYHLLRMSYENWCADHGLVPLGVTSLKRVMSAIGKATPMMFRDDSGVRRAYFLDGADPKQELVSLNSGMHVGLKVSPENIDPEPVPVDEQTKLVSEW